MHIEPLTVRTVPQLTTRALSSQSRTRCARSASENRICATVRVRGRTRSALYTFLQPCSLHSELKAGSRGAIRRMVLTFSGAPPKPWRTPPMPTKSRRMMLEKFTARSMPYEPTEQRTKEAHKRHREEAISVLGSDETKTRLQQPAVLRTPTHYNNNEHDAGIARPLISRGLQLCIRGPSSSELGPSARPGHRFSHGAHGEQSP